MVRTGGDGRLWVLSGPSSSYALRLTDRDELLHLYWGPPITLDDAERLAAEPLPGDWPGGVRRRRGAGFARARGGPAGRAPPAR
ncbi:alpha-galactosidase, partial [Streptomyces sp. NPDC059506]